MHDVRREPVEGFDSPSSWPAEPFSAPRVLMLCDPGFRRTPGLFGMRGPPTSTPRSRNPEDYNDDDDLSSLLFPAGFDESSFPAYVAAMMDLVKSLNKHVTTPNWNKDVAAKLDKMVEAVRWPSPLVFVANLPGVFFRLLFS